MSFESDNPLITVEAVGRMLADLTRKLIDAGTVAEMKTATEAAAAFREVLRRGKASLRLQNQAAALRLRGMRQIGKMLADLEKHKGGRPTSLSADDTGGRVADKPVAGTDRFPTLAELGISRDYSSECQQIARMSEDEFNEYLAAGLAADDTVDRDSNRPQWEQPRELSKAGCLAWASGHNQRRWSERQSAEREAKAIREAEEAAKRDADRKTHEEEQAGERAAANVAATSETVTANPPPAEPVEAVAGEAIADDEIENELTELLAEPGPIPDIPPPPPEPEPPPRKTSTADTLKAMLRKAIDPAVSADERDSFIRRIQRDDPRLECIDAHESNFALVEHLKNQVNSFCDGWNKASNRASNMRTQLLDYRDQIRKLQEEVRKLQSRDRIRLNVIRTLNAKIERLEKEQPARDKSGAEHVVEAAAVNVADTQAPSRIGQREPITGIAADKPLRSHGDIDPRTSVVGAKLVKGGQSGTVGQTRPRQAFTPEIVRAPFAIVRPKDCLLRRRMGCQSRKLCRLKDQCLESQRRSTTVAARLAAE